jgi:hypothetical protein
MEIQEREEELNRDFCDDSTAVIACKQCLVKLCEHHQKNHIVTKTTMHHELVLLDKNDSDTILAVDSTHRFVKYGENCELHKSHIADKYYQTVKDIQPAMMKEFKEQLIPQTTVKLEKLQEMSNKIDEWTNTLDKQHEGELKSLDEEAEENKRQIDIQLQERKKRNAIKRIRTQSKFASSRRKILLKLLNRV